MTAFELSSLLISLVKDGEMEMLRKMKVVKILAVLFGFIIVAPSVSHAVTAPYTRTVIVSPGTSALAGGTALLNALAAITDNSSDKRYLIKIESGVYDLAGSRLQMKEWVDIEGTGTDATEILGAGPGAAMPDDAIILGANNSEVRQMTIGCLGTTGCQAMANIGVSPRIKSIKIDANLSTGTLTGIRNVGASPSIEDVEIILAGGDGDHRGIFSIDNGSTLSRPTIKRVDISLTSTSAGTTAAGIWSEGGSNPKSVKDVEIEIRGNAQEGVGMLQTNSTTLGSRIFSTGQTLDFLVTGPSNAFGIKVDSDSYGILIRRSRIRAYGANGKGISVPNGLISVSASDIRGETRVIEGDEVIVNITVINDGVTGEGQGPDQIDRVVGTTSEKCALLVDEDYKEYLNSCP